MRAKAFTLMELIITTIIVAVIAGFAIPGYQKAMARQKVKRLMLTADLIAGAQEIYKAKNGRYWCDFLTPCAIADTDVSDINAGLGVSIIPENGVIYVTWAAVGLEDEFFQFGFTDGALFLISDASAPPLDITCTNLSAMNVCP